MQINRLHLFVSQCITAKTVKVVKAKTTILQGARVCTHARETLILHSLRQKEKLWGTTMIVVPHVTRNHESFIWLN